MGKNKKSEIVFFDEFRQENINVDSQEEFQFYCWIIQAKKMGIVLDYVYQPDSFLLTEKRTYVPLFDNPKDKEKHLMAEHIYTADFKLTIAKDKAKILAKYLKIAKTDVDGENGNVVVWLDIKGGFMSNGGGRSFSINQKLVYDKHGIYVNKLVPRDFFVKCGCPDRLFLTEKTKKPSKVFAECPRMVEVF